MTHMQGIVSILRSDNPEKPTKAASLRRTLSADMSSKKWLADNGLSLMKKITIDSSSSDSSKESDEEECEVIGKGDENPRQIDIWTAIMSKKNEDDSVKLQPPYVHPLVKKSARSLSDTSLKVCTESLGSETGADVFLSNMSSKGSDENTSVFQEEHKVVRLADTGLHVLQSNTSSKTCDENTSVFQGEHKVVRHTCLTTKKSQQPRSFPPPIPSLAVAHTDGPSLQMHSRRINGRLVLEAVSVPPQKYFEAQRQDGRFLLTLINDRKEEPLEHDVINIPVEEKSKHDERDDINDTKTDSDVKDIKIRKERALSSTTTEINVQKYSMVTVKRIMERDNQNAPWSRKLNTKKEKVKVVELSGPRHKGPGLPPLPPPVNSYEYFWRAKPTVASVIDPMTTQHRPPTKTKDLVLIRGNKADFLLPSLKCYKEPRRSNLMWEPFCIATS